MIEELRVTDIKDCDFDFSPYFKSTDSITAISVSGIPSGMVEVEALRYTIGQTQHLLINGSGCTPGLTYTLGCQATGTSGARKTLYKTLVAIAEPTGIAAVPSTGNVSGTFTAILAQAGTAAPTVSSTQRNSLSGTPTHSRYSKGRFRVTLAGTFLAGKVHGSTQVVPQLVGAEFTASPPQRISDDVMEYCVYDFGANLTDGFGELHIVLQTYT